MFGHDDNKPQDDNQEPQHDAVLGGDDGQQTGTVSPADDSAHDTNSPAYTADLPTPAASDASDADDAPEPAAPEPQDTPLPSSDDDTKNDESDTLPTNFAGGAGDSDLLNIKTSALKELSPLVGHLDQSPEEKFRTTMMMIQASDDQSLIKEAYSAAQAITDEKVRAQALLDIVNEINYFTQHG
jgi:hypothetical protein